MFIIQCDVINLASVCTALLAHEFVHERRDRSMGRNGSYWARLSNMPCHAMPVIEILFEHLSAVSKAGGAIAIASYNTIS